ncbi:hypothetical protein DPMN_154740 [Dreissena polymorpha]|uniref:Uncharacterized protein n=1 Tax=Dreissena polymorpha TaxID=45954 RepID=A0A9D4J792_DREPO|nr:hypothetical protein DPMN_154740 [Dreissena polymorpha]
MTEQVSTENSKIVVNITTNTTADITMNSEKSEEVICFKFLGRYLSKDGTGTA